MDPAQCSASITLSRPTENEAAVFFGREARLAQALGVIDDLRRGNGSRIFSIIAASGVGKSSFLKAGLWPRLARQSGVAPLVVLRPAQGIIFGREGGLTYALSEWFRRAGQSVDPGRSTGEGLIATLLEAARVAGEGRTLILGIDQAEELFDTTDPIKADEARGFLEALLALLAQPVLSKSLRDKMRNRDVAQDGNDNRTGSPRIQLPPAFGDAALDLALP